MVTGVLIICFQTGMSFGNRLVMPDRTIIKEFSDGEQWFYPTYIRYLYFFSLADGPGDNVTFVCYGLIL